MAALWLGKELGSMGKPIRNITIVGGGSTGWLVAALLNHRLQWGQGHPDAVNITLIESPDVPIIGVGEATIPPIRHVLAMLEIDEAEFVTRTHATFKMGVQFENWDHNPDGSPRTFFHAFTGGVQVAGRNPAASLLEYGVPEEMDLDPQLSNIVGHGVAAGVAHKSPRRPGDAPYSGVLGYAYHFDAGLLAEFLKEICLARGVVHLPDTVLGAERDDRGHIAALQLKDGGRHPIEFVVDCSGFRGLLINETLEEPFVSFSDYLFNDRAIAMQVAHGPARELPPMTQTTAMDAGWRWRIPLQSRIGTGHVFSSRFISEGEATDQLLAVNKDAKIVTDPRPVAMRVGRCCRTWVGNCVAIGLASGFVEPLESTSIQFVDYACRRLLQLLPSTDFEPAPIAQYNREVTAMYEDIRDFLGLHFTLGNREDTPYWRAMKHEAKRSDALEECLALWRHSLPSVYDPRSSTIFTFWSVTAVLFGKQFYKGPASAGTDVLPREMWERFLKDFTTARTGLLGVLPDHGEMLRLMGEAAVTGTSAARVPSKRALPMLGNALGPSVPVMSPGAISLNS